MTLVPNKKHVFKNRQKSQKGEGTSEWQHYLTSPVLYSPSSPCSPPICLINNLCAACLFYEKAHLYLQLRNGFIFLYDPVSEVLEMFLYPYISIIFVTCWVCSSCPGPQEERDLSFDMWGKQQSV